MLVWHVRPVHVCRLAALNVVAVPGVLKQGMPGIASVSCCNVAQCMLAYCAVPRHCNALNLKSALGEYVANGSGLRSAAAAAHTSQSRHVQVKGIASMTTSISNINNDSGPASQCVSYNRCQLCSTNAGLRCTLTTSASYAAWQECHLQQLNCYIAGNGSFAAHISM